MPKKISYRYGKFTINCSKADEIVNIKYSGFDLAGRIYSLFDQAEVSTTMLGLDEGKLSIPKTLRDLSFEIFDCIKRLNDRNKECIAISLADFFFNLFLNYYDRRYKESGRHVLCISLWKSVLRLVYRWESKKLGNSVHKGTPYYYLAETYILCGNIDTAFIYLFKGFEEDLRVNRTCPKLNYTSKSPCWLTACLIDNKDNSMYHSVVLPVRKDIDRALNKYRRYSNNPAIKNMAEIDRKFLNPQLPKINNLNIISKFFVLELLKLLRSISSIPIDRRVESDFSKTLLLNRLFGFALVIDMLLYEIYTAPSVSTNMGENVMNFVKHNNISTTNYQHFLNNPGKNMKKFNEESIDGILKLLLDNHKNVRTRYNLPEEMIVILIAYKLRNTSAHKIQSNDLIFKRFRAIVQRLYEALFILINKIP